MIARTDPVQHRHIAAAWYLWGLQDAGLHKELDVHDFADFHAEQARAFHAEPHRTWLPSVMEALTEYIESKKP